MRTRTVTALAAVALTVPAVACSAPTTTGEQSYQVDQPVTALVIGARAAAVGIVAGAGPVTVTETYRYSDGRPNTSHRLDGGTLRLTESGCGDDDARCEVRYRIRVPAATTTDITAQAGAVTIDGLAGDVHVTTEAGAVEGRALAGGTVVVRTQAGAASLEFAEAPAVLEASTTVGAVEVRVPGDTGYALDVAAGAGRTEVSVPEDAASVHRITVRTEVGAVRIAPLP